MDKSQLKATIEAILFAVGYPVKYSKLASVLELEEGQVESLVDEMIDTYEGRGIQLVRLGDCCQLCTREEYLDYIKDALGIKKNGALSKSSLETLAIIAYNQPVTKAYVEQVRGADSSYAFGVLTERGLIYVKDRLDVPGRPNLYATTPDFLRIFGLSSLSELPTIAVDTPDEETDEDTEDTE